MLHNIRYSMDPTFGRFLVYSVKNLESVNIEDSAVDVNSVLFSTQTNSQSITLD